MTIDVDAEGDKRVVVNRRVPGSQLIRESIVELIEGRRGVTVTLRCDESAALIELRGEVGGNVTIQCAVEWRPILFLYFQKGTDFVNGYHASKKISSNKWANTWMSQDKAVHIYSLKVSHGGDYDCLVKYNDSHEIHKYVIHLSITANFSKPAVTLHPIDDIHWLVTCSSHGGYPSSEIMWNVPESPMVKAVNSSETTDPVTLTINRSSTVFFNCSGGEMKNLSCSVGGVTSDIFSVCEYQTQE
uniref:uncharacterized protein n=1 Tax=Semicossyphus pulcher TaxID=241346 RepID=UPI0037E82FF8